MANSQAVVFYDTTLRDGEQMPGVAFAPQARLEIARALDNLGVDEIEVGFAASSERHAQDMRAVAESGVAARLLSLARFVESDIDAAARAGMHGVIIVTCASDVHLEHKLRRTYADVRQQTLQVIRYAKSLGLFAQLSIEDATRVSVERLQDLAEASVQAGADRIGLADTVGIGTPESMQLMVQAVRQAATCPIAVHCHNDFGLAVANSMAAVRAGAAVLSTTILGLGERSGNAATEACAVALEQLYGLTTNIDLTKLADVCALVRRHANVPISYNTPIAGRNSFRHESGIHVAAVLREPSCYEPFPPELVGQSREFVLGKTSGRAVVRLIAGTDAHRLDDDACRQILDQVKDLTEEGTARPELIEQLIARHLA